MRYPIAIEIGTEAAAYGVVVPDLPGCFSAGDSLDEAVTGAQEAAAAWIDAALDSGAAIPVPSALDAGARHEGWMIDVISPPSPVIPGRSAGDPRTPSGG